MQFHTCISAIIVFFFMKIFMGLKIEGRDNIPRQGGLIIASNHLSNWDPLIIAVAAALKREVFFLAKEELFKANKFYSVLMKKYNAIPIKRYGIDRKTIRISSSHLHKKRSVVVFPEGKRNLGKENLKPLPGVGYLALKTKTGIVPTLIEGSAEKMMDLIRRRKRVCVKFGKVIDVSKLYKSFSLLKKSIELSNIVMKEISLLGKNV